MFLTLATSHAAVYKGQKEYVKKCRSCHGGGQEMAHARTQSEWKELMASNGKGLVKFHVGKEKAAEAMEYFKDGRFKKYAGHLEDFFVEYAEDSGNVPACN